MASSPASSKQETEERWLRSVIIPDLVKNGKLQASLDRDGSDRGGGFKVHAIEIKFIGSDEAFMLTTCYRATIEYEYRGKRDTRTLVVKKTPEIPEETFNAVNFAALFSNEIEAYVGILPAIANFSKTRINVPRFYYGDLQRTSAALVLEDFNAHGWRMTTKRVGLSLEHVMLAVNYLATFHGVSYALKRTDRKLFDTITSKLRESRYASPDLHPDWLILLASSVQRVVVATRRHQPSVEEEFLERLEHLIADNYKYGKQRVEPVEPLATLCHGDYLRNNVAYRYEDENSETPADVMMFDLQTMRYSSPMVDLTVFLALSAFADVRAANFQRIFAAYCEQLAKTYVEHASEALPPFLRQENLLREYIRFLPYAVGVCASFLMTLVAPDQMSSEEMLLLQRTPDEVRHDTMTRGGEVVDRELAHQVKEMFDLSSQHGVDIGEGIRL